MSETPISTIDDDIAEFHSFDNGTDRTIKALLEKVDDLENRSRRNNLRIIGIPESYNNIDVLRLCTSEISETLGLNSTCVVERAHRIGAIQQDKKGPWPSKAKYLNYADKAQILQRFRNKHELMVEGHSLLLFGDYSLEVSRTCKAFSKVCAALLVKQIKFSLAYPATLLLMSQSGRQLVFLDPKDTEAFLNNI